jgi:hypothetical protein
MKLTKTNNTHTTPHDAHCHYFIVTVWRHCADIFRHNYIRRIKEDCVEFVRSIAEKLPERVRHLRNALKILPTRSFILKLKL